MKTKGTHSTTWQRTLAMLLVWLCATTFAYADDWNIKDKDGVHHKLSEQKGKWVLVNFWAPWCPSCLQELPDFSSLQQRHADVQVIGIAVMYKSRKEVLETANKIGVHFPIVFGNEDIAAEFGGMLGMPTSVLYTPAGKLVGTHDGPLTLSEMELAITQPAAAEKLFPR